MTEGVDADAELVTAFVESRRVEDFERLVARYQQTVFRVVVSVLGPGHSQDAEDVTQEVFVQVYRRIDSFERRSRFSSWLYRIAYNRAVDARRALRARPDSEALTSEPAAALSGRDVLRTQAVADCLSLLPDAQRMAIHLHYWLGYSVAEIAATLSVQTGTVKAWMFRARHLVARCLASKGVRP